MELGSARVSSRTRAKETLTAFFRMADLPRGNIRWLPSIAAGR